MSNQTLDKEAIHRAVTTAYGAVARATGKQSGGAECCAPSCCTPEFEKPSDYKLEELAAVPKGAYLGQGSGAPVRFANLEAGEKVVDLGSGAGMDTFLAANAVGTSGRVWGFDLTPEMLERARRNAAEGGYANVSFDRADIEKLPLAAASADAAISNCVINLAPDKHAVYREIFRVLRPGGRLSVADIVMRGPAEAVEAFRHAAGDGEWCACVAGALEEKEYLAAIRSAGFDDVRIAAERPAMSQPGGQLSAVAVTITARKPA
jgi:SAM-dependent methyltransferase